MKRVLGFALLILAVSAVAADEGKIEIFGKGQAVTKPEQVQLTTTVVSICYARSIEAKNANADLASKIVAILQKYKRDASDEVNATGGPTLRQSEYLIENGTNRKVICERGWRATNTLTLKTSALNDLPEIQDAVLSTIDGAGGEAVSGNVVEQTYAQVSEPSFTVYPETQLKLRAEAQKKAWADAKVQFAAFNAVCPFKNPRLIGVTPPSSMEPVPHFLSPAESAGGYTTPVLPEELIVNATWKFTWAFDPSGSCTN